ncbi:MAG: hypothetical protein IPG39_18105 [Bacteroidetes bacterium]|nr:hypothetical protein [Bacteroidota bacterium]
MILEAKNKDDDALISSEISMPENATYANIQTATLTADSAGSTIMNIEDMDVFKQWTLKFRHITDVSVPQTYNQIDNDPEEISDLFVVFHYCLGDVI